MITRLTVDALLAQGRFRETAALLDSAPILAHSQRVLRAWLAAEIDGAVGAQGAAQALLPHASGPTRAMCLEIKGLAAAHLGDPRAGLKLLEAAITSAGGEASFTARLEVRIGTALLNWIGVEPALARLSRIRRRVMQAGEPSATIAFHLLCAEIEIKRDDVRSEVHLRTAAGLLERFPNIVQDAKLFGLRSNIAAISCDYISATTLGEHSLRLAEEAGWMSGRSASLANLAHVYSVRGELETASAYLRRAYELMPPNSPMALGIISTEIEVAIAQGEILKAGKLAESLQELSRRVEGGYSYYGLWYLLTRAKLLLRSGRFGVAADIAKSALPFAYRLADRDLIVRLELLAAEAFASAGDLENGIGYFAKALMHGPCALDNVAEASRVTALLCAADSKLLGDDATARANRILNHTRVSVSQASSTNASGVDDLHLNGRADGISMIHCWMAATDLSLAPKLAGAELLRILRLTGIVDASGLVSESQGEMRIAESFGDFASRLEAGRPKTFIELGSDGRSLWKLALISDDTPSAALTIVAIQRLWYALAGARSRIHSEATPWTLGVLNPTEPPIELFGMVIAAKNMVELLDVTRRVASSAAPVLFTGETGTGKELFARALHEASPRREMPFIPFNCTAVARDMLDSQLFGYRRGAFTGAQEPFQGVIRAASGGTLFLDEIGEMPLDVQPKLLRFLESGEIHPLGEPRPIAVDVRVVAATNANLEQLVADGRFREDLFYRLNVVWLQVPPLRERREEIPLLAQHYLDKFSRESNQTGIRLAEETMEYLLLFKWPGNVRQLANEVRRMVALAESGAVLMPEHLSKDIAASRRTVPVSLRDMAPTEFVVRMDQPMSAAIEHLERSMIQYAMKLSDGRFEDAAQLLGLSRKGLYLKRQRLKTSGDELDDDEPALRKIG